MDIFEGITKILNEFLSNYIFFTCTLSFDLNIFLLMNYILHFFHNTIQHRIQKQA
jgi:hypothetical protein